MGEYVHAIGGGINRLKGILRHYKLMGSNNQCATLCMIASKLNLLKCQKEKSLCDLRTNQAGLESKAGLYFINEPPIVSWGRYLIQQHLFL